MTRAARLISIEAVDELATALACFRDEVANALAEMDQQVKRAMDWVQHDRKEYWSREVHQGFDRVAAARTALQRKQIIRVGDARSSAIEEKKALAAARLRLHLAEEKLEATRRWTHVLQHESDEFRGALSQLVAWLESDLPRALAALERMSRALEDYVAVASTPADAAVLPSAARPIATPEETPADLPASKASPASEAAETGPERTATGGEEEGKEP